MCGIVGAIRAHHNVVDFLTDGLKRLEYRGYDSSGIAVQTGNKITRVRRVGRVQLMENAAREKGVHGHIGIGHTRWATHGGVTEAQCPPAYFRRPDCRGAQRHYRKLRRRARPPAKLGLHL